MAKLITVGISTGPVRTRRAAGESLGKSIQKHVAEVRASVPMSDELTTSLHLPGRRAVVTTVRFQGESDQALLERHLSDLIAT